MPTKGWALCRTLGQELWTRPVKNLLSGTSVPGMETDTLYIITEINVYVRMVSSVINGSALKGAVTDYNQGLPRLGVKEDLWR